MINETEKCVHCSAFRTVLNIFFIFSDFTGTLMSDSIASIPGNGEFNRNLSFSKAFKIVVGKNWYSLGDKNFHLCHLENAHLITYYYLM